VPSSQRVTAAAGRGARVVSTARDRTEVGHMAGWAFPVSLI
jgi:hypothetical protein